MLIQTFNSSETIEDLLNEQSPPVSSEYGANAPATLLLIAKNEVSLRVIDGSGSMLSHQ